MRRILHGFILLSWIAFTASVTVGGLGFSQFSLLQELQFVLMAVPLGFETARAVLTGVIVATLAAMLWALMIAVTSAETEHRERVASVCAGFASVLAVTAAAMLAAAFTGLPTATAALFALQIATFLTMLAAGGVEFAWQARSMASAREQEADGFADRVSRQLAASSASLAAVTAASRDCGEPV